jgi:cytochrome c
MRYLRVGILAGALALSGSAALAQGDPEKGERVFNKCKVCHIADEEKNKVGPTLVGIFGRPGASKASSIPMP